MKKIGIATGVFSFSWARQSWRTSWSRSWSWSKMSQNSIYSFGSLFVKSLIKSNNPWKRWGPDKPDKQCEKIFVALEGVVDNEKISVLEQCIDYLRMSHDNK